MFVNFEVDSLQKEKKMKMMKNIQNGGVALSVSHYIHVFYITILRVL